MNDKVIYTGATDAQVNWGSCDDPRKVGLNVGLACLSVMDIDETDRNPRRRTMAAKFTNIGKQFRARAALAGNGYVLEYKYKDGWKVCAGFHAAWLPIFKENAKDFKAFLRNNTDSIKPVRQ